jgi:hypothetical protein
MTLAHNDAIAPTAPEYDMVRRVGERQKESTFVGEDGHDAPNDLHPPARRAPVRVTRPTFYCPFPAAVHAQVNRIEEGTIAWMKRYGYIKTARDEDAARCAEFGIRAARVHPTGSTEAIQLVSDLTVWLFLTDDVYVEESGMKSALSITADHMTRSIRVLRNPEDLPLAPSASLLALQDIANAYAVWPPTSRSTGSSTA